MWCTKFSGKHLARLESGWVYFPPPDVFARANFNFAPVTIDSLSVLFTVLNPVSLCRSSVPCNALLAPLCKGFNVLCLILVS